MAATQNGQDQTFFFGRKSSDFVAARETLITLQSAFGRLNNLLRQTLESKSLLGLSARSSEQAIRMSVNAGSKTGTTVFQLQSTAQTYRISSDVFGDPDSPLDFTGALSIGGVRVTISPSDTLNSLAASLNQTEDVNGNSLLEDSEDRNRNGLLDFGNQNSGVSAWVEDGRLFLESITAGSSPFSINSENGVAESLGLLKVVPNNTTHYKNIVHRGTDAVIAHEGQIYVGDGNRFTNLPNTISLEINPQTLPFAPSEANPLAFTATVSASPENSARAIREFVSTYNKVMAEFNDAVMYPGVLDSDVLLFTLRADMLEALNRKQAPNFSNDTPLQQIADMGIEMRSSQRLRIPQLALIQMRNRRMAGVDQKSAEAVDSVPGFLKSLQQIGVVDRTDGLLEIDETTLHKALVENREQVYSLLASEDQGVLEAFRRLVAEASSQKSGRVNNQIQFYDNMVSRHERIPVERQRYFEFSAEQFTARKAMGELLDVR
ncbi:MAG TPA: flagellar filament capping protein FliD, partial [bacterium]|nr:flagellar filament capping protein FliD [bacterium]